MIDCFFRQKQCAFRYFIHQLHFIQQCLLFSGRKGKKDLVLCGNFCQCVRIHRLCGKRSGDQKGEEQEFFHTFILNCFVELFHNIVFSDDCFKVFSLPKGKEN